MTAVAARTLKEARAVLYPWAGVILLCALPLLSRIYGRGTVYIIPGPDQLTTILFQLGVFMGIPLLACLSYGNEFRYKTLDLLVSQPVNRLKTWREKGIVTAIAILTTALVATISSRSRYPVGHLVNADTILFLIVITCAAPVWTLIGKSTLGGFALNIAAFVGLMTMKAGLGVADAATWVAALVYSGFMLWLGRWMLVHRQSNGGAAGGDVMDAIPRLLPAPIASLFRCRPNQVILNLIRKEARLLRPLWLFTTLYVMSWSAMAISSSFIPLDDAKQRTLLISFGGLQSTHTLIALLLAASLAFGEERTFGVQLWHLALPLSIRTQWLIRFASALIAAVACTIAVPALLFALTREVLHPVYLEKLELQTFLELIPPMLIFFLVAFWCAVVARDLIRTAGLLAATGGMIFVTVRGSDWITEQLISIAIQLRWLAISRFQLNPAVFEDPLGWLPRLSRYPVWILAAFCVVMIVHSYPLFRRLPQESAVKLLRPLIPYLAVVALLASLTTAQNWRYGWGAIWKFFSDTETAIVELPPDTPYKAEDLARVSPLPAHTRQWLSNATMTATLTDFQSRDRQKEYRYSDRWKKEGRLTIQFQSGMTCNATFLFSPDKSPKVWGGQGTCE